MANFAIIKTLITQLFFILANQFCDQNLNKFCPRTRCFCHHTEPKLWAMYAILNENIFFSSPYHIFKKSVFICILIKSIMNCKVWLPTPHHVTILCTRPTIYVMSRKFSIKHTKFAKLFGVMAPLSSLLSMSKLKNEINHGTYCRVMHVQDQCEPRPHFDEQMVSENLNCHFVKALIRSFISQRQSITKTT